MYEFTKRAEFALENTRRFAMDNYYSYIGTEHLLYGLIYEEKSIASKILAKQNITSQYIAEEILKIDGRMQKKKVKEPELTPRAKRVLENSMKESKRMGYNYIGTEHILLALMKETDSIGVRILIDANVDPEKLFTDILKVVSKESPVTNIYNKSEVDTPTLNMYSEDLNLLARSEKIDKIVGRENELYIKTFRVKDYNLLLVDEITEPILVDVKIRYKSKESKAYIRIIDNYIEVSYLEPQKGVTLGQSAVFYVDDIVLGGGIIE